MHMGGFDTHPLEQALLALCFERVCMRTIVCPEC